MGAFLEVIKNIGDKSWSQDLEYQNFAIFGDSVDTFDGIYAKKLDASWISGQSCTLVSMFDLKLKS